MRDGGVESADGRISCSGEPGEQAADHEAIDRGEQARHLPSRSTRRIPELDDQQVRPGRTAQRSAFPRDVIAKKLGVSIAGLARGGVTEALTSEAIDELVASPPQWLVRERRTQVQVRKDAERIKEKQEARRTSGNRPTKLRNL